MTVSIDKGSALESLNITPLIDVVFLLLIFFLVATRFTEEEREMEVRLPQASEARPLVSKPRELLVNVDAAGRYSVAGHKLAMAQLVPILETAWVNNPAHASVIIRADERCPWEFVVAAMNACQKANIRDWSVTTREAEE